MKIVEFTRNMQENKSRGLAKMNDGNFLLAIKYFKNALCQDPKDISLALLIGRCYFELNAYDISLEWLFLSLKNKDNHLTAFQFISKCYLELNQFELAFVYVAKCAKHFENTIMPPDIEKCYLSLQEKFMSRGNAQINGLSEVNKNLITKIKMNLAQANFDKVQDLINQVSPESFEYIEAKNIQTTIALMNENYDQASELSSEILQKDNKNIFALCNKALCYYSKNDKVASISTIKFAIACENLSVKERFYIATTLCQLNIHKAIIPYLEEILQKYSKFHYDFMLLLSIAYYNVGEFDRAICQIDSGLDFYENDILYMHYKNIFLKKEQKVLPYTNFMYAEDILFYNEKIKNIFGKSDDEIKSEIEKPSNIELLVWGLKFNQNDTNALIIFNLIKLEKFDLLTEFCLSTRVNNIIKMTIVKELLLQNKLLNLPIVFEGIFTTLSLKELKKKIEKSNNFEQSFIQSITLSAR